MLPYPSKFYFSFFIFLFCGISFAFGQHFEGKITITNTIPNTLNAVFTLKKDLAMMESENEVGKVKMINNAKTGQKITLQEKNGETIVVVKNSNDMQYRHLNKKYEKKLLQSNHSGVKVTRETKKINGYKCYKVIANGPKYEGEAWISKKFEADLSTIFPITSLEQRAMPRIAKALQNSMKGFVMEMTIKNIKTKKVEKMTVSIEKKQIKDLDFEIDMQGKELYSEENVREMMKAAKGNPEKMKKARTLLAQIRMQ